MRLFILLFLILFLVPYKARAEKLFLKSGRTVEGKILEQTDSYIKFEFNEGGVGNIYRDEIKNYEPQRELEMLKPQPKAGELIGLMYVNDDGSTSSLYMLDGKEVAKRDAHHQEGAIASVLSEIGPIPDGIAKVYISRRLLTTYTVKNNRLNGPTQSFWSDGTLQSESSYKDNVLVYQGKILQPVSLKNTQNNFWGDVEPTK
jgi:antitoxin component YwqK of YwqJK toxin-antitoxin module